MSRRMHGVEWFMLCAVCFAAWELHAYACRMYAVVVVHVIVRGSLRGCICVEELGFRSKRLKLVLREA